MEVNVIPGKNAVLEAIRSKRKLKCVLVYNSCKDNAIESILSTAKKQKLKVKRVSKKELDEISKNAKHQGVVALAESFVYSSLDDIFLKAQEKKEDPFMVLLDGIKDPHNLGAIIRTAECVGAHGVIIPANRSASITDTVEKTSAGAVEHIHIVRVQNISKTIDDLKKRSLWIFGAEANGRLCFKENLKGPIAIVIGSEGKGISRLVKEKCDGIISIPLKGFINSLNASVAAGVVLYEVLKQRIESGETA